MYKLFSTPDTVPDGRCKLRIQVTSWSTRLIFPETKVKMVIIINIAIWGNLPKLFAISNIMLAYNMSNVEYVHPNNLCFYRQLYRTNFANTWFYYFIHFPYHKQSAHAN